MLPMPRNLSLLSSWYFSSVALQGSEWLMPSFPFLPVCLLELHNVF